MPSKKVSVTLSYASKGTQPPIFLAGSFSEPAWDPQEMESTIDAEGEHHFHKEVEIDEGAEFQYKFRIGLGDWWALNEQAPTVTDALGNRNNLLLVPSVEETIKTSQSSESTVASAEPAVTMPELIVEKVDDEPRHGDDFGPEAATGQKDAHQMRALDAEPDQVLFRSQTSTSLYANNAAEVADSAAILDREPSPAPVPDEEAGRTGERRISTTPIPQVALTAAEVADIAAMLDQVEDSEDDSSSLVPLFPHESHSGETTPWHERAPLFAHECLGPNDGVEIESPITSDSLGSPIKADPAEEVIDLNDPLLEPFPEDRLSILTHIRSCESRMSEDETNVHGVPPSPITRAKSRSPSIDTPGSARLDAQPSPGLDVITEEHQDDGYFDDVLGPTHKLQGTGGTRVPDELNVIQEAEEPVEEPKNVLENLRKIEESMPDSNNTTIKRESLKPEVDEIAPVCTSNVLKEQETSAEIDEVHSGPPAVGMRTGLKSELIANDQHTTSEQLSVSGQISQSQVNSIDTSRALQEDVPNPPESPYDKRISDGRESEPYDGPVPEVKTEPKEELEKQEEVNVEQSDIEREGDIKQDNELLHTEKHEGIQNDVAVAPMSILQHSQPVIPQESVVPKVFQPVDSTGHIPGNENPEEGLKNMRNPIADDVLEEQEIHMDSLKAKQHLEEESQEINESPELKQAGLEHVNGIPKGQVLMKDIPIDGRIETQDVVEASNIQEMTAEHVLDTNPLNSEVSPENTQREADSPAKSNLPVSRMNIKHVDTQVTGQGALASDKQESAIEVKGIQMDFEGSAQADLPISPKKGDRTLLNQEENMLGSKSQVLATSRKAVSEEANRATQEAELPASAMDVNEQCSQKLAEPMLQSDVDKSAVIESRPGEAEAGHEENQSNSTVEVDEEISATHPKSAISDVGDVDGMLANEVDAGKSTCDNHLSPKEDDKNPKLDPPHTPTPKTERPLTPSSIRSPLKVVKSDSFFKSIWRTLFVEWIGGIFASLCGGDRGPLVAISVVVIIGPVLAMYFFRVDELLTPVLQ